MKKGFILILLFLVSCQGAGFQTQKEPPKIPDFFVGTSALEIVFSQNSNSNIFMCQEADVIVQLSNKGSFDIVDGVFAFIVEDQVLSPQSERIRKFSLAGKSIYDPRGGFDQFSLRLKNNGLPSQLETYSSPVIAQACYKYQTSAAVSICIDPDSKDVNPRKPCKAVPVSVSGGQGAPVEVVRVESSMVPIGTTVEPSFKIFLKHSGAGQVVLSDSVESACLPQKKGDLSSVVQISVELQGQKLDCGSGLVRIEAGKENLAVCNTDASFDMSTGTFSTFLNIKLDYGYVNNAVMPVNIARPPGVLDCS